MKDDSPSAGCGPLSLAFTVTMLIVLVLLLIAHCAPRAHARDLGHWSNDDPAVRAWYKDLMQPDVPTASCCGEADAYWADDIHVRGGKVFASITDDRPDEPRGRPHRAIGEEFEVPPNKLKWDRGNPTGHSIIFLSTAGYVYCFVQSGGT